MVGNNIVLTYDNDFNVAEVASSPANPNPEGPLVQLETGGRELPAHLCNSDAVTPCLRKLDRRPPRAPCGGCSLSGIT